MSESLSHSLIRRIQSVGGEFSDPDLQVQKTVLVVLSLSVIPLSAIWISIELSIGNQAFVASILTGAILSLFNLLLFAWMGNYKRFLSIQLTIILLWPVANHFVAGGLTTSSNLAWSMLVPLVAMLSSRPREAIPWVVAYFVLIGFTGLVEPMVFPDSGLNAADALFKYSFNTINISALLFLVVLYFIRQKNRAYELLQEEERKSEDLLLKVLPKEVALILRSGKKTIAEQFESASILYADIVGFTPMSERMAPDEMIALLDEIFSSFDEIIDKYDLEKIRTIGDNYMVVSGAPRRRSDHAQALARAALEMADYARLIPPQDGEKVEFRIGMNSGPVVGGVIGQSRFHYDVWGDAVNTASRMESHGVPGRIQITSHTQEMLADDFIFERRGFTEVKGKGRMETWYLVGSK
ncbi:MAG: adenylate/guanylate cyclase domain-containing protein [Chloroflexi bacterium]|nr:adenylate/guanylate cyclase domain-containing protein [Chloroflexota bacterium]